ncbi:MAG: zf-HC2 domain-containing protein [Desulfomonile tiedjei]|nr:zf-HC2 domain-containing protein [Desulfomonile tiedjei]
MSDCDRISALFGDVYDEQMDGESKKVFDQHLHHCPGCREDMKWYGITVRALTNLEQVSPPPNFVAQVNARLQSSPASSSFLDFFKNFFSSTPYLPLPAGVAALAFVAVIGIVVYNQQYMEIVPSVAYSGPTQTAAVRSTAEARSAVGGTATLPANQMQVSGVLTQASETSPSSPAGTLPLYSMAPPSSFQSNLGIRGESLATIADRMGADNLTVESPSIDIALESLKKILPNIQGQLVDQRTPGNGGVVVGVLIPPSAYGRLTTELINHGAVETGAGSEAQPVAPLKKEGNNVLLYIRFVRTP